MSAVYINATPIILFVYNRLWHTQQTVEALKNNELANESELFIYSDGPKTDKDQLKVKEVREYIHLISGFKKVTIIERKNNWGLANSIIDGVTEIVNKYGKIIVLEDDLLTSPCFLRYMNDSLSKYQNESSVFSITGYSHSNDFDLIDSTYFLQLTSSWSWGTWKDKWKKFSKNTELFDACLKTRQLFNYDNSYDYSGMVELQLRNKIDSWAIFWYATIFLQRGLTLYPNKALVVNIGFDGSGTHCGVSERKEQANIVEFILTDDVYEKDEYRKLIALCLKNQMKAVPLKIKIGKYFKNIFKL